MVDLIPNEFVDSDEVLPDNTTRNDNQQIKKTYAEIEELHDPNNEYIPIDNEIITPTKFMRLKNMNIVQYQLSVFQRLFGILLNLPFFWSINGAGLSTLTCTIFLPRILCENIVYPIFRLIFGTLYPAYASYKAVRHKDVKEYVSNTQ